MAQVPKNEDDETTYTYADILRQRGYDEEYIRAALERMAERERID